MFSVYILLHFSNNENTWKCDFFRHVFYTVRTAGIFDFTVVSLFRIKRRSGNDLVFLKLVQHSSSNDYTEINL